MLSRSGGTAGYMTIDDEAKVMAMRKVSPSFEPHQWEVLERDLRNRESGAAWRMRYGEDHWRMYSPVRRN